MPSPFEIIREHYAASDRKDLAGMMAPLTAETAWTEMAGFPYAGTFVGPEAIVEGVFKRIGADFEGFGFTLDQLFDAGDAVIATGEYSGTYRRTGKPFRARVVHVWQLQGGTVRRFEQFTDTRLVAEAMR